MKPSTLARSFFFCTGIDRGKINAFGLYDIDRNNRPAGKEYRRIIRDSGYGLGSAVQILTSP
jgi:hypothetical protein